MTTITKDAPIYPEPPYYPVSGVSLDAYAVEAEAERLSAETIRWMQAGQPHPPYGPYPPTPPFPPIVPGSFQQVIQTTQLLIEQCTAALTAEHTDTQGEYLEEYLAVLRTWVVTLESAGGPYEPPPVLTRKPGKAG